MTSILITGANGFIGSHFGQRARRRGWRVLGADLAAQDMTGNCHDYREVDLCTPGAGDLPGGVTTPAVRDRQVQADGLPAGTSFRLPW